MPSDELFYTLALCRQMAFSQPIALQLYCSMGSAQAVYEHRNDLGDLLPEATPRLRKNLMHWDDALQRAEAEMQFITQKGIRPLTLNDDDYPGRMRNCPDAPILLFYLGSTNLNQRHVINMVGTRHCTSYGQDIVRRFVTDLRQLCPDVLIVSGLAYGIDICAHRAALQQGFDSVGVLAHGLDQIYPSRHRDTAVEMVHHGGLLTEYMSQTQPVANNFRQRNRIVAGISDATILVESAIKGGGLITCRVAQEYGRDVFAFPGAVGQTYSEGCNLMIRNNTAALITSAQDFVDSMGWQTTDKKPEAVERQLFPNLNADEQRVVSLLNQVGDLQLNILSIRTGIPISTLTALLFQLEMKGVVRPLAGGTYHLLA